MRTKQKEKINESLFQNLGKQGLLFFKYLSCLLAASMLSSGLGYWLLDVDYTSNKTFTVKQLLLLVVIAPLIEEYLFREFIPSLLERRYTWKSSMITSNLVFALFHGYLFFLPFFLNGVIYSLAKKETNSLQMPILLHITYNLVAALTQIL